MKFLPQRTITNHNKKMDGPMTAPTTQQHPHIRLSCDHCSGRPSFRRGPWIDTIPAAEPLERDPECSICHDSMETGEKLIRHTICKHTFHQSCVEGWVDHVIRNQQEIMPVTCGMCRAPIAETVVDDGPWLSVKVAPANFEDQLRIRLMLRLPIKVVPRPRLQTYMEIFSPDHQVLQQFSKRYMTPDAHGILPTYDITPGFQIEGSEIFQGQHSIQAAAIEVTHCAHWSELILMKPSHAYKYMSCLYTQGWTPGFSWPMNRIQPGQPMSLHHLLVEMQDKMTYQRVDVSAAEIAAWFPTPRIQRGQRLLLTKQAGYVTPDQILTLNAYGYQITTDGSTIPVSVDETQALIDELGHSQGEVHWNIVPPDEARNTIRNHHSAYLTILKPFKFAPGRSQSDGSTGDDTHTVPVNDDA